MTQRQKPASLRRFGSDRRGIAIVEFAMIAPLLILFYVGMAEICQGLMAERRTTHATSAIGDLISQVEQVSGPEVDGIFNVAGDIMAPFPMGSTSDPKLKLRVSSVVVDSNGVAKVAWSRGRGMTAKNKDDVVTLPSVAQAGGGQASFLAKGESTIMAEAEYDFQTPFSEIFVSIKNYFPGDHGQAEGFVFRSTYYLRPRRSEVVAFKTS